MTDNEIVYILNRDFPNIYNQILEYYEEIE
jgi:hypothetical protein